MERKLFIIRHSYKPRGHGATAKWDTHIHRGDHERVHCGMQHFKDPCQLWVVQLRSTHQPPCFQAPPFWRLPGQWWQTPNVRSYTLLPICQHLPLSHLCFFHYLLTKIGINVLNMCRKDLLIALDNTILDERQYFHSFILQQYISNTRYTRE